MRSHKDGAHPGQFQEENFDQQKLCVKSSVRVLFLARVKVRECTIQYSLSTWLNCLDRLINVGNYAIIGGF